MPHRAIAPQGPLAPGASSAYRGEPRGIKRRGRGVATVRV